MNTYKGVEKDGCAFFFYNYNINTYQDPTSGI